MSSCVASSWNLTSCQWRGNYLHQNIKNMSFTSKLCSGMTVYGFWKNARDWVFGSFCLFWVFPLLVFLLYFAPNMKVAYWYYKNEILLAVSWKMRLDCDCQRQGRRSDTAESLRKLKKSVGLARKKKKNKQSLPVKERWWYFQFADCCFRSSLCWKKSCVSRQWLTGSHE